MVLSEMLSSVNCGSDRQGMSSNEMGIQLISSSVQRFPRFILITMRLLESNGNGEDKEKGEELKMLQTW